MMKAINNNECKISDQKNINTFLLNVILAEIKWEIAELELCAKNGTKINKGPDQIISSIVESSNKLRMCIPH